MALSVMLPVSTGGFRYVHRRCFRNRKQVLHVIKTDKVIQNTSKSPLRMIKEELLAHITLIAGVAGTSLPGCKRFPNIQVRPCGNIHIQTGHLLCH